MERRQLIVRLVAVAALAFVLREAIAVAAMHVPLPTALEGDAQSYTQLGYSWANGHPQQSMGGTDWGWAPLYPAFLGAIIKLRWVTGEVGSLRLWIGTIQAVLAAAAVFVLGLLVHRRTGSERLAWVGALLFAVWPGSVTYAAASMSEGLYVPLFVVAAAVLFWWPVPSMRQLVAGGGLLAVLLFIRPQTTGTLLAVPVIVGWVVRKHGDWRLVAKSCAAVLAPAAVVVGLWVVVVTIPHQGSAFLTTTDGFNLCEGNSPHATGRFTYRDCDPEKESHQVLQGRAVAWIVRHPWRQLDLVPRRFFATMESDTDAIYKYPSTDSYQLPIPRALVALVCSVWWMAALVGVVASLWPGGGVWRRRGLLPVLAFGASSLLGPLVTVGDPRLHMSFVPFMAIMVAVGWGRIWARFTPKTKRSLRLATGRSQSGRRRRD